MKTYTKRALSWVLAISLLITCGISGLVLPAAAEPATDVVYSEDFQDADHGWTVAGAAADAVADGETNKAMAMVGAAKHLRSPKFNIEVKTGERYLVRLKMKATAAAETQDKIMLFFYNTTSTSAEAQSTTFAVKAGNTYTSNYYTIPTTGYMYIQHTFNVQKDASDLQVGVYSVGGSFTALVDDVEVVKVTPETNLASGGDFEDEVPLMWFTDYLTSREGTIVTEADGNKALKTANGGKVTYLRMTGTQNKKLIEVKFRYKGKFTAQPYYAGCSKQEIKKVSTSASTEWREYKAIINTANSNVGYIGLYPAADLLLDDFVVRFVTAELPATEEVLVGNNITLAPTVSPADVCATPKMTWESANTEIATVADGVVTGVAVGTATINLKDSKGNILSSCAVTVKDPSSAPALTAIALNKTAETVIAGNTATLIATGTPAEANMADLVWESSNTAVATVDKGVVTAVKAGTATITAKVGEISATCEITVENPNLFVNGDFEQGASVNWDNNSRVQEGIGRDGSWGYYTERPAGNTEYAASGGVYYKGALLKNLKPNTQYILSFDYKHTGGGKPQIYLMYDLGIGEDGKEYGATANVHIEAPAGETDWTTYTLKFTTGNTITGLTGWEINVRSLGQAGMTYYDNFKLVEAPVAELPALNAIVLDKTAVTLEVDGTATLTATADPEKADISTLTWESSDATIAKVENGVITALAAGTATITAKVGEVTATCTVTVNAKPVRPQQPTDPDAIIVNGDFEADAKLGWDNDSDIKAGVGKDGSWGIEYDYTHDGNGNKIFSVSYDGTNLKNLKPSTKYTLSFDYKSTGAGFAQLYSYFKFGQDAFNTLGYNKTLSDSEEWKHYEITFTTVSEIPTGTDGWSAAIFLRYVMYGNASGTGHGYAAFDNVKLTEVPVATAIKLDKETANVKVGKTFTLAVSTVPEVATKPEIVWTTSDASIATVADGVVTGVAAGTATITATAGSLVCTCTVTIVADDGNLFENGDFEQGKDVAWGGNSNIMAGVGKDGSYGVKIESKVDENTTSHQQPSFYYQNALIDLLQPDAVYELSFDYKHEGKGFGQIYLNKDFGTIESNNKDFYKELSQTSGNVEWKTVTYTFFTPSAALSASKGYEFLLRQVQYNQAGNEGTGVTYFDNFKLVKVRDVLHADAITLAPSTLELKPGASGTLKVMTQPNGAATGIITYASADTSIATVDKNGKVTAVANSGEVKITATNDRGKTAEAIVVIREDANLIKNGDFEQAGENWKNHANVLPGIGKDGGYGLKMQDGGKAIYYGTSLSSMTPATTYILTFDYILPRGAYFRVWTDTSFGLTASYSKNPSKEWKKATVIFTTAANLKLNSGWDIAFVGESQGTDDIAVVDNVCLRRYDSDVLPEKLNLDKTEITLIPGRTGALNLTCEPKGANMNDMVWTSSNENVATVDFGVVTAIGKGTATVTAKAKNGKTVSCNVIVSGDETYIKNGTFDDKTDTNWQLKDGAVIVDGEGRSNSAAAKVTKGQSLVYEVKGLKPGTEYQLSVMTRTSSGALNITLMDGETQIAKGKTGTASSWAKTTIEFTTPADCSGTAVLTLAPAGSGPVYVDNVRLNVKASLVDFVVSDLFWVGGGYQVKPGTELEFGFTVTNQGEDAVKAGETLVVELRKNGKAFMTIEKELPDGLESGGSVIFVAPEKWKAEAGHWVISARANPTLSILEMVDTNNTTQKNLRVDDVILEAPQVAADLELNDLTFSDEFDSLNTIDQYASGDDGYKWYVTRQWAASTITPDCYSIEDGIISLHSTQPGYHVTLSTMDVNTAIGYTWNKGYLEVRLCIPNKDPGTSGVDYDGSPAIWSFPDIKWLEKKGENHKWVEMDWLEYWGVTADRPGGYYTITFHETYNKKDDQEYHWYSNNNAYREGLGDEQWHTMGWLWVDNAVVTYVDGVQVQKITYSKDGLPSCRLSYHDSVDMDATGAYSLMNELYNVLYVSGGKDFPLLLDYVRIWQGSGTITLPDDPAEDEAKIDVDAEEFWYYYCTDNYGDNIMEATEENYEILLEGGVLWNKLTDESKAAINALLASYGQPTFDELLAQAEALANPSPDTGATTVLPVALSVAVMVSGAVMVKSRKRKERK